MGHVGWCRVIKQHGRINKNKRNRRCGVWLARCIVKQHGRIKKEKKIDDAACGLHTASSNNMEELKRKKNRRHGMWVAHRVVVILPVSFSPSTSPHTPSILPTRCRYLPCGCWGRQHGCRCREVVVGWCMGLLRSTSLPWVGPHMGIGQGARRRQWVAARWW
jgi:hypothetical protein